METISNQDQFRHHLRKVLGALYDPAVLRSSPLLQLLGLEQRRDPASALRRALIDAIEALRPGEQTPTGSRTWRLYHVLRRRYTEQLTQHEVASDLGLSVRQLQREEKLAREVLGDHLWAAYHIEEQRHAPAQDAGPKAAPTRAQELEQLRQSVPSQHVSLSAIVEDVLMTIRPLLTSAGIQMAVTIPPDLPRVLLRPPLMRQALLTALSAAARHTPQGQIALGVRTTERQVTLHIDAVTHVDVSPPDPNATGEGLGIAAQLVELCRGHMEITTENAHQRFEVRIALPIAEQITVLCIDDNDDVLQLFQRYLSGSPYRFVGTSDPEEALALAECAVPQAIVLDVMMPERDGWTLLGQLREHPDLQGTPIIVCTILSQERLALALGAATFMRKPVSRAELLTALEHQLAPSPKTPD